MAGFEPLPLPQTLLETLPLSTHVADVVTAPIITPLAFARDRGCAIQTGRDGAGADETDGAFIGAIAQEQGAAA